MEICEVFRVNIVDVTATTLTVEASGKPEKLEALRELLNEYGIVELSRTGRIALARGDRGIRERVLTIDHDTALEPRPPFEKLLVVDSGAVSDIQAFGYNPQSPDPSAVGGKPRPLWCLLRQDLYFNQQSSAFLIVHWKHAFNGITLLDVIPGERTELVSV